MSNSITMPPGYPPWNGQPSVEAYLLEHFPKVKGMENNDWIRTDIKQGKDEPGWKWATRVANHPLWTQVLTDWPGFDFEFIGSPYYTANQRIDYQIANFPDSLRYFDLMGGWMDRKVEYLKSLGFKQKQKEEKDHRYGYGMAPKNATYCLLRALGVQTNLAICLSGESAYFTNSVCFRPDLTQKELDKLQDPKMLTGLPPIMVCGLVARGTHAFVIRRHQFEAIHFPSDATEESKWTKKTMAWEVYQTLLCATLDYSKHQLTLHGWARPETIFRKGLARFTVRVPKVHFVMDVEERGNGVMVDYLKESKKMIDEQQDFYSVGISDMSPPVEFLRLLRGFDESRISTEPPKV